MFCVKAQDYETILVFESGLPYTEQTWFYSGKGNALQQDNIKKHWDEGRRITSAAYTGNGWFVTMSKNTGIGMQTYHYNTYWPTNWIKTKWDEGYHITTISKSDTHWLVIMSQDEGFTSQTYWKSIGTELDEWMNNKRDEGFLVTSCAFDNDDDNIRVVMSKNSNYSNHGCFYSDTYDDLKSRIKSEVWDKGYNIHLIEYMGVGYVVFYGTYSTNSNRSQSYVINPSDVKGVISEKWNENMNISYIGGGYNLIRSSNYVANNKINGHEYVDLGLSVKWATCNVGANKPEDYGNYYAWGETSTKSSYTEDNSKTFGKNLVFTEDGKNMILSLGDNSQYDAARANWGGTWRLPTDKELVELMNKCTWTWTTQNGVKGYKVTGPNGNSIFLPAAGSREGSSLQGTGEYGCYWSSKPFFYRDDLDEMWLDQTHYAYELYFDDGEVYVNFDDRYYGLSVRPVSE